MSLINKLKIIVAAAAIALVPAFVPFVPVASAASQIEIGACMAAHPDKTADECNTCMDAQNCDGDNTLVDRIIDIIQVVLIFVGLIATVMIIFGGFKYLTSAGDEKKVVGTKNTILYAVIGLIISLIASLIVQFVIKAALNN